MKTISKIFIAAAITLAAAPAIAQEMNTLSERNVYYFTPDGRMVQMKASEDTHATLMKNLKLIPAGTIIYASGGKIYTGQDAKMPSGQTLSSEAFGKDLSVAGQR
jgi:hypothetical protein